jgi:hypothetical protein
MSDNEPSEMVIATVTITHVLTDERSIIYVVAEDASGDELSLVEALGLLRFAEDSVIRDRMGETPDG